MDTLHIKDKLSGDVKFPNELLITTNNNVPLHAGRILWISEDMVDTYAKMYEENPDMFIEENISKIRILKPADYAAMIRRQYEKYGGEYRLVHINDRIEFEEIQRKKIEIDMAEERKRLRDK